MLNHTLNIFLAAYNAFLVFLFFYMLIRGKKNLLLFSTLTFIFFFILWNLSNFDYWLSEEAALLVSGIFWCFVCPVWFIFIIQFTSSKIKYEKLILIIGFVTGFICFLYTLQLEGFISLSMPHLFMDIGIYYSYFLIVYSLVIFFRFFRKLKKREKSALKAIIPLGISVIVLDLLYSFPLIENQDFSIIIYILNKLCSLIVVILFSIELFQNSRFNNLIPISFKYVLRNMNRGVIVCDYLNTVVLVNTAFKNLFQMPELRADTASVSAIANQLNKKAVNPDEELFRVLDSPDVIEYTGELAIASSLPLYYGVKIQPVVSNSREIYGRIITFTNISQYKKLITQLDEQKQYLEFITGELNRKNQELKDLNKKLVTYAEKHTALACENERKKISARVYSMLNHNFLTVKKSLAHVLTISRTNKEEASSNLQESIDLIRNSFRQINLMVQNFLSTTPEFKSLTDAINDLSRQFTVHGMDIEFSLPHPMPRPEQKVIILFHKICHTAFTNSLLHGKAKTITALLKMDGSVLKLYIFDDGIGCIHVKPGGSLSHIREEIEKLKGKMVQGSDGIKGFNLVIEIPVIGSNTENTDI